MEPQNLRFGGGVSQTMVHPIILIAVLIACVDCVAKQSTRAFLAGAMLIPTDQVC